ncbi:diacylglycerol/lipid kinase family protein [Xanthobacter tagetidis]|jgi:diacylglycerol kinase family enzyme|uniref:Diacylglycerol kinase n=1 Tax=Xanthobacter tagetidis TaxID=60216 RepID=A0A3L6ZZQ5_9HYPH|nr:diacylglycerol kinase family protein [Xanthobacter tagetidis]MBB6310276.1 diacylglycerol kinase family enzyme [Xanthobacter tagetidis]RLP72662.1 diacylglycerol kinase [Xanthobacter tagetidis]
MRRMLVVLNAQAGTMRDLGAEQVRDEVDKALTRADMDVEVMVASGEEMVRAIDAAPHGGYDTLVVGAGDGTVSYAASVLAGTDIALGVLPLGTMNLLAHDIGLPRDLPGALAALSKAEPMRVDLGTVNGRPFHGVSGLGFFSQMALAREQLRKKRGRMLGWLIALVRALVRSGRISLEIEIAGQREPIEAYAALVTVNAFDAQGLHRSRLDGGHLEVLVAEDRGALAKIKASADVLVGSWRDNPGIHTFTAERLTIHARRRRTWVATDGEVTRENLPLRYAISPKALMLLVPPEGLRVRADIGAPDAETLHEPPRAGLG